MGEFKIKKVNCRSAGCKEELDPKFENNKGFYYECDCGCSFWIPKEVKKKK